MWMVAWIGLALYQVDLQLCVCVLFVKFSLYSSCTAPPPLTPRTNVSTIYPQLMSAEGGKTLEDEL